MMAKSRIPSILHTYEEELLEEWMHEQLASDTRRADLLTESELRQQSAEFLGALRGHGGIAHALRLARMDVEADRRA
jgi:rsbT co-antagonist protein RsbR